MENAGESKAALTSHSSLNSLTTWAPQIRFAKILRPYPKTGSISTSSNRRM
jgi:hypothetical protein